MKLERTEIPGIWMLTIPEDMDNSSVDTLVDTGLLRHRPSCIAAVSWCQVKHNQWIFHVIQNDRLSLLEAVETMEKKPKTGFHVLNKVMKTVERSSDHLFPIIAELLHPELLFATYNTYDSTIEDLQIVTLPLVCTKFRVLEQESELIRWLGMTFQWEPSLIKRLQDLFMREAFFDLLLETKILNGEPLIAIPKQNKKDQTTRKGVDLVEIGPPSSSSFDKQTSFSQKIARERLSDRIITKVRNLGQIVFGTQGHETIHEVTEDLDLSTDQFQIAQLSEGLPGTPEEELGQHAYILTEEFVIGRDMSKCDLWVDSFSISRQHAKIRRRAGSYFLEDLGSKNGTTLDGIKLTKNREYLLPDKCKIAFANKIYHFRSS